MRFPQQSLFATFWSLVVLCLGVVVPLQAQPPLVPNCPIPHSITVTGQGEMRALPDEVSLTLVVQGQARSSSAVKAQNDQQLNKVMMIARQYGIRENDIVAQRMAIGQEYQEPQMPPAPFVARRTVMLILREPGKLEALTNALTEADLSVLENTEFRNSAADQLLNQARVLAMRAAKEKAQVLAKEAGRTVGKALVINDGYAQQHGNTMIAGAMAAPPQLRGLGQNPMSGQTLITASVTVTFQLE